MGKKIMWQVTVAKNHMCFNSTGRRYCVVADNASAAMTKVRKRDKEVSKMEEKPHYSVVVEIELLAVED